MPLEQTEPFHHEDRGNRPHALLTHLQLNDKVKELVRFQLQNPQIMDTTRQETPEEREKSELLDELLREFHIRRDENKVEPSERSEHPTEGPFSFTEFQRESMADYHNLPMSRLLQDLHRSDDVFEQAWGITKMPLVRDSIESEDEDDFYHNRAVFQDRDDSSKQYPMETYYDQGGIGVRVRDPDNKGRLAARAYFNPYENRFSDVGTNEDYRRKGMMTAIYDLVNEIQRRRGRRLKSDARRLSGSSAPFWAKALGLPYEGHTEFQRKYGGQGFEWPEEGVYE